MTNFTIKVSSIISYLVIGFLLYGFWSYHHAREERINDIRAQTFIRLAPWLGRELTEQRQWRNHHFVSVLNTNVRDLWNDSDYPIESITFEASSVQIRRKSKLDYQEIELEFNVTRQENDYIVTFNIPSRFTLPSSIFTKAIYPCINTSSTCFLLTPAFAREWANQP